MLDSQFRGMKQALEGAAGDPNSPDMQRVKDMMSSLNQMLDADARGEHTQEQFDEFMPSTATSSLTHQAISRSSSTRSPVVRRPRSG